VVVDASGWGKLDVSVRDLSLDSTRGGVAGRSLVVHENPDDLRTDPTGNSGSRIACGTIHVASKVR